MQPNGAKKNKLAQAIFSNDGPNLNKPDVTNRPKVMPNKYKASNKNNNGIPNLKTDTPKRGIAMIAAGTIPIKALKIAVNVSEATISLIFIGAMNKLVKFLLRTSY